MTRVLHVSEAFGSGVVTAVIAFAANSPWAEHHLLVGVRPGAAIALPTNHPFKTITELPSGGISAIRKIRSAYKAIQPDVVHLHSSHAGAYGRLAGLPRHRLVYTPHCFSFENTKQPTILRAGFYLAEQILSLFGGNFAGVSPRECELARRMVGARRTALLPNFAVVPEREEIAACADSPKPLRGAMIGRLVPQKDPEFFLATWQALRRETDQIQLTWIGGGDAHIEEEMRSAGVGVTGWISQEELFPLLQEMDFYVHTAAWEGNPMSVLEAAALGLPVVARDIPSLRSIGLEALAKTPSDLARKIAGLREADAMLAAKEESAALCERFSRERQVAALQSLYR